jgi:ribosomal protein S18 acetylase RimI-like enzyme
VDANVQSFAVANLRRRPVVVEAGGFVAGFDPGTTSPYINYATPTPGAEPTRRDVAALIAAFRTRGLMPRLEFAPDAAPEVEPALRTAGFTVEEVHEYLVCTPATLTVPRVPALVGGPRVETPVSDQDYAAIDAALSEAFTGKFASSPHGAGRLRRVQENGGAVRFVRSTDRGCAGGASCSAPAVGTSELSGVGTRPAFRVRGIATAVTAALTEAMFASGTASVWLEYSGEGSRRVYERVGYHPQGTRLYMSLEG